MNLDDFIDSLGHNEPPAGLESNLQALWHDARGDWHTAHEIVQSMNSPNAARIHAYLHRKEGDEWNSRYWHRRARSEFPAGLSLDEEWEMLVKRLL